MTALRAGLIGAGERARIHLEAFDELIADGRLELVAVADPIADAARSIAEPRAATTYDDPEALLTGERLDIAYLVVPYNLHPHLVATVLRRGIHLFVEKPLAVTARDTGALLRLADDAAADGTLTCVAYDRRWSRSYDGCAELLADTPPAMFASHWYWGMPVTAWARRFELNGGQVFAQLSHHVDLARALFGPVETVSASAGRVARVTPADLAAGFDNDDVHAMTLTFTSGAVGSIHGTYALFPGAPDAQAVRVIARELLIEIGADHLRVTRPALDKPPPTPEIIETGDDRMPRMHGAFVDAIVEGRPELIRTPASDAAMTSFVCAAANESARTGQPIVMAEFVAAHTEGRRVPAP
jgi:predicted dehydrogenase